MTISPYDDGALKLDVLDECLRAFDGCYPWSYCCMRVVKTLHSKRISVDNSACLSMHTRAGGANVSNYHNIGETGERAGGGGVFFTSVLGLC